VGSRDSCWGKEPSPERQAGKRQGVFFFAKRKPFFLRRAGLREGEKTRRRLAAAIGGGYDSLDGVSRPGKPGLDIGGEGAALGRMILRKVSSRGGGIQKALDRLMKRRDPGIKGKIRLRDLGGVRLALVIEKHLIGRKGARAS